MGKSVSPGVLGALGVFISSGCGISLVIIFILIGVSSAVGIDWFGSNSNSSAISPEGLNLSIVPPNYASLFTEASQKSHVPAALIAALYLTEHHTDSFGKDLKSIDQVLSPCTENSSGAAGPMQFIPGSWPASGLKAIGIASPDRCKYRDSIIGAGLLLAGKVKYPSVQAVCKKNSTGEWVMTDKCISDWGQSYCGVGGCHSSACSNSHYLYCEEVVRKYKLVAGK